MPGGKGERLAFNLKRGRFWSTSPAGTTSVLGGEKRPQNLGPVDGSAVHKGGGIDTSQGGEFKKATGGGDQAVGIQWNLEHTQKNPVINGQMQWSVFFKNESQTKDSRKQYVRFRWGAHQGTALPVVRKGCFDRWKIKEKVVFLLQCGNIGTGEELGRGK